MQLATRHRLEQCCNFKPNYYKQNGFCWKIRSDKKKSPKNTQSDVNKQLPLLTLMLQLSFGFKWQAC